MKALRLARAERTVGACWARKPTSPSEEGVGGDAHEKAEMGSAGQGRPSLQEAPAVLERDD